jgi:hypothetical protein
MNVKTSSSEGVSIARAEEAADARDGRASSPPVFNLFPDDTRAMSSRFCSLARRLFFLRGDLMTIQETPQRGPTGANALLAQRHQNLLQGRVRPLLGNCQNLLRVLLQPRRASAARLRSPTAGITHPPHPFDRRTYCHIEDFRRFAARHPRHNSCDQSRPQITRMALGIAQPSSDRINPEDSPTLNAL